MQPIKCEPPHQVKFRIRSGVMAPARDVYKLVKFDMNAPNLYEKTFHPWYFFQSLYFMSWKVIGMCRVGVKEYLEFDP